MTRYPISFAALATILVALDAPSNAQAPPALAPSRGPTAVTREAVGQPRFKGGVDLVSLDVCVRDASGRFLTDLTSEDFLVLENGSPQRISFVMPSGTLPLRAVLLIDRSGSMHGPKLERAVEAAGLFARRLGPRDQLGIIAFNQQAARVHAFHTDPARVAAALASVTAMGSTSLYDALLVAANDITRARAGAPPKTREAVIVLSDGEDTASLVGFEEVLPVLRRSGALVYTVSLRESAKGEWLGASWPLLALARDTGARALGLPSLDALPALYAEIDAEVRHLYRIGFVSSDERHNGQWRNVAVRVLSRDARVQTRTGYYAPGPRLKGRHP
jgi:Ca-activated chloride channel family protein